MIVGTIVPPGTWNPIPAVEPLKIQPPAVRLAPRAEVIKALVASYAGQSWDDLLTRLESKYKLVVGRIE